MTQTVAIIVVCHCQFCFGSTFVQLNPNYRKFDRMDPMTWKKEGIASHWTGVRGYRKKCCKVKI